MSLLLANIATRAIASINPVTLVIFTTSPIVWAIAKKILASGPIEEFSVSPQSVNVRFNNQSSRNRHT